MATSETVVTNYLKKNLDADVKIVAVAPVSMRFEPMLQGNLSMHF